MSSPQLSSVDQRILDLLTQGATGAQVALSLGISESRVSQLLSDEQFSDKLALGRYEGLKRHNERDAKWDSIEDKLLASLERTVPMVMQPEKIARILQIVNQAKRRGASSPDHVLQKQTVVQLHLPVQIVNRFQVNGNNQVTTVVDEEGNSQSMVTVQSGKMKELALASIESQRQSIIESRVSNLLDDATVKESQRVRPKPSPNLTKFGIE